MAGIEDIVGKTGNYHVRDRFKRFDNKFIRPLILKHVQVRVSFSHATQIRDYRVINLFLYFCMQSFLFPSNIQSAEPKILETYSKLAMKDAMDFMHRNPSTINGQMTGTESMSALFRSYQNGAGRLAPPFLMNPW